MEPLRDLLGQITRQTYSEDSSQHWTIEQWKENEKRRAELFNKTQGRMNGVDCHVCNNRGSFARVNDNGSLVFRRCDCMRLRDAQSAIRLSGLPDNILNDCTFDKWETPKAWQRAAEQMARKYVDEAKDREAFHSWFIMCGKSGCGKTRLCTTIFRAMVENGYKGVYISWRDFARKAKSVANNNEEFERLTGRARKSELVYIDDFWKGSVTPGDVHLAFEIINERYCSGKLTIISSEYTLDAIMRSDEAIGSRLGEMSENFYLDCRNAENWRAYHKNERRYA